MTNIKVSELHPAGYDLLAEPESYMTQLDDNELDSISGGDEPFNDKGDWAAYISYGATAVATVSGAVALSLASPASGVPGAVIASAAAVEFSGNAFEGAFD